MLENYFTTEYATKIAVWLKKKVTMLWPFWFEFSDWRPQPLENNTEDTPPTPFCYRETNDDLLRGVFSEYPGGGYMMNMGSQSDSVLQKIDYLKTHGWLDRRTRMVVGEISTYNANVNLMSSVRILFEIPESSGVFVQVMINSFKPYPYVTALDTLLLLVQVIWGVVVVYITIRTAGRFVRLVKIGQNILNDPWLMFDAVTVIVSYLTIAAFVKKSLVLIDAVEYTMNNKGNHNHDHNHEFKKPTKWQHPNFFIYFPSSSHNSILFGPVTINPRNYVP